MRCKLVVVVGLLLSASGAFGQSWTIGNEQIERTITFDPATGLGTQRLTDLTTHTDLIPAGKAVRRPAVEFSFRLQWAKSEWIDVPAG